MAIAMLRGALRMNAPFWEASVRQVRLPDHQYLLLLPFLTIFNYLVTLLHSDNVVMMHVAVFRLMHITVLITSLDICC